MHLPGLRHLLCAPLLPAWAWSCLQGFMWNVNSFDQWGVELGKVRRQAAGSSSTQQWPLQEFRKLSCWGVALTGRHAGASAGRTAPPRPRPISWLCPQPHPPSQAP